MKRPIPSSNSKQLDINRAVKENLEQIMGQSRSGALKPLADTATLAEVITKINEILGRMQ